MTPATEQVILDPCDSVGWDSGVAIGTIGERTRAESDDALVRLARNGDAAAFDRLAAARIDGAYRLAVSILRSEPDARDAVQDAFVAVWRRLPDLRDPARFDAWLDRIVVNACRMSLRHRRVVRLREIDVEDPAAAADALALQDNAADPGGLAGSVADADLVRRAFARLDSDKRAILVLHHVEDRPVAEIAGALGIPSGTVKWRLHAARAALERALEEESR
jgi:RNA polymerase sigma-70 factor (ECF subfamily)